MEATFYEDSRFREKSEVSRSLKRPMTLDLDSNKYSKKSKMTTLLTSPDLNMLKLGSPELERLIILQHNMGTSTPTPNQCMFPPKPSDDREYQSRDFPDALTNLQTTTSSAIYHSVQGDNGMGMSLSCQQPPPPPPCNVTLDNNAASYYQQTPGCNSMVSVTSSGPVNSAMVNCYDASSNYYAMNPANVIVKEEPQTVPCMGATPPLSPIDMENQERIKLERKRLRNRIAASKCRRRKLERIARLEDKVNALKGENLQLTNIVTQLRDQVCTLKQQVMEHVRSGCDILPCSSDMQF